MAEVDKRRKTDPDAPKRVIVGDDPGPTIESVLLEAIERIKTEIPDDPIESVIERVREGVLS